MTLNAVTGAMTGSPLAMGTYYAHLIVTDSAAATVNSVATIYVQHEFRFEQPSATLTATALAPFFHTTPVSGANGYIISRVNLKETPSALHVDATTDAVRMYGILLEPGQFNFKIELQDASSRKAWQNVSITVFPALSISSSPPTPFPRATVGAPFAASLMASGGTQPYTWRIRSGSLPPGLSLSAKGTIEGSPAAPAGSYSPIVEVADALGAVAVLSIPITTVALKVGNTSMPAAVVGQTYYHVLNATGGQEPYDWSVSTGSLPAGLRLLSNGTVVGIAAEPGAYEFAAQVSDRQRALATVSLSLPVKVDEVSSIEVLHAATLDRAVAGATWVSLFGRNLAPATLQARAVGEGDLVGGQLPVELDGITVRVEGSPGRLTSVAPGQINVLLPEIAQEGTRLIEIATPTGVRKVRASVLDTAPGLFTFAVPSSEARRAAFHTNGAVVTPEDPARPGETVVVYGTGFGPTNPPVGVGEAVDAAPLASSPLVLVGGVPAKAHFAARVSPGMYQINVEVPALARGQYPLRIEVGGRLSQIKTDLDIGAE